MDSSYTNLVYFGNYKTITDSKLSLYTYHISYMISSSLTVELSEGDFGDDDDQWMKIMNLVLIYQ